MRRSPAPLGVAFVLGFALLLVPAGGIADDCTADVDARLEHTDESDDNTTRLQFKVEVSTQADCGKILYDLVIEEMLPNGQTKKIRKPNVITLHNDSLEAVIQHEMPKSHSMLSFEAEVVSCSSCGDA